MSGETDLFVMLAGQLMAGGERTGVHPMGTVLSPRVGRVVLVLAILAGMSAASTLPAAASPGASPTKERPAAPGASPSDSFGDHQVVLGPAVKYAHGADGSVVRVR